MRQSSVKADSGEGLTRDFAAARQAGCREDERLYQLRMRERRQIAVAHASASQGASPAPWTFTSPGFANTNITTRRFLARPSVVLFEATGCVNP